MARPLPMKLLEEALAELLARDRRLFLAEVEMPRVLRSERRPSHKVDRALKRLVKGVKR